MATNKTFNRIGTTLVQNFTGVAIEEAETPNNGDPEEETKLEVPSKVDPEANRLLNALMVNFGASIREKILKMQEEALR